MDHHAHKSELEEGTTSQSGEGNRVEKRVNLSNDLVEGGERLC
jgi:hypothetical protein